MKYSNSNKPMVCMMTNSTCYNGTYVSTPVGVLWHSTGANNPTIKRYVQPSPNDKNYSSLMAKIGRNNNGNSWNQVYVEAGVNAWIGELADGSVSTVQALPWNYAPWGVAQGWRGSCNGFAGKHYIQFEICEDSLSNKSYFEKVYKEACELTAYLCKMYKLDPYGTVSYNGAKMPVIMCHKDAYNFGMGSGHADVYHWFNRYGKDMNDVRKDVAALMNGASSITVDNGTTSTPNTSKPTSSTSGKAPNITYAVKTKDNGILPDVRNREDYAGYGNSPIVGIKIGVDSGSVKYRVHTTKGVWLPYVTGSNWNDYNNGYAGDDVNAIDAIEVYYNTDTSKTGGKYYCAKYQVKAKGYSSYFDNQIDNEKSNGMDGYAGAFGCPIVEVKMSLE